MICIWPLTGNLFFLAPVRVLRLFMVLPRESHSKKIRSKNKSVNGNAVTGIWCSLVPLIIDSCFRPHSSNEVISCRRKTKCTKKTSALADCAKLRKTTAFYWLIGTFKF